MESKSGGPGRLNSGCEWVISLKPSLVYLRCVDLIDVGYMRTGHESRLRYVVPH